MFNFLRNPLTILAFTLVFAFFFFSLRKNAKRSYISVQNVNLLENEVDQLISEVDNQKKQLEVIQQPLTKEKIVRNELLLQKPGEYVVQLPPASPTPAQNNKNSRSNPWGEWRKLLFE
jgi:hypothetical protein